ncbi:hypothetical protein RHSIM_RhsimUnG0187100 [Rhododendron simsii]|uniref:Uncharacterized protein n=1 Tax=Rhododendron simsii TaxID=118357 RepID=A0A834L295_RHOSS|nr:hypothetical protein RHSIM_RhsimUnG0187100 [Rhododendron simsii]
MVSVLDVPVEEMRIESMIDNVRVTLTPDIIAKYLGYTRPPLSTVNYPLPGGAYIDPALVNSALYSDMGLYDGHHKPGLFREEYRLLNKAIHVNLFPRGSEHHPRQRGAELLFVFASEELVFDAALWIFYQVHNFQAESQNTARMPFPCMISKICKSQKVRGPRYAHLEPLKPGPLDASFVTKSKSQSHDPPSPKRKTKLAEMTEMPGPKEKLDSWVKKLFCMTAWLVKENRKMKQERKVDRKVIARQAHKVDWLVQRSPAAAEYVAPPEVESEDSDESENEEDEELNPGIFRGEGTEFVVDPGASGGDDLKLKAREKLQYLKEESNNMIMLIIPMERSAPSVNPSVEPELANVAEEDEDEDLDSLFKSAQDLLKAATSGTSGSGLGSTSQSQFSSEEVSEAKTALRMALLQNFKAVAHPARASNIKKAMDVLVKSQALGAEETILHRFQKEFPDMASSRTPEKPRSPIAQSAPSVNPSVEPELANVAEEDEDEDLDSLFKSAQDLLKAATSGTSGSGLGSTSQSQFSSEEVSEAKTALRMALLQNFKAVAHPARASNIKKAMDVLVKSQALGAEEPVLQRFQKEFPDMVLLQQSLGEVYRTLDLAWEDYGWCWTEEWYWRILGKVLLWLGVRLMIRVRSGIRG